MSKKKVAESIIIRVGGGIREVPRDQGEALESPEAANLEPGFDQTEDTHPFGEDFGSKVQSGSGKIIN